MRVYAGTKKVPGRKEEIRGLFMLFCQQGIYETHYVFL
jgi:hypothetical protein